VTTPVRVRCAAGVNEQKSGKTGDSIVLICTPKLASHAPRPIRRPAVVLFVQVYVYVDSCDWQVYSGTQRTCLLACLSAFSNVFHSLSHRTHVRTSNSSVW